MDHSLLIFLFFSVICMDWRIVDSGQAGLCVGCERGLDDVWTPPAKTYAVWTPEVTFSQSFEAIAKKKGENPRFEEGRNPHPQKKSEKSL